MTLVHVFANYTDVRILFVYSVLLRMTNFNHFPQMLKYWCSSYIRLWQSFFKMLCVNNSKWTDKIIFISISLSCIARWALVIYVRFNQCEKNIDIILCMFILFQMPRRMGHHNSSKKKISTHISCILHEFTWIIPFLIQWVHLKIIMRKISPTKFILRWINPLFHSWPSKQYGFC